MISITLSHAKHTYEKNNCKKIKLMGQHLSNLIGLNHFFLYIKIIITYGFKPLKKNYKI